jgi:hypothetical protein
MNQKAQLELFTPKMWPACPSVARQRCRVCGAYGKSAGLFCRAAYDRSREAGILEAKHVMKTHITLTLLIVLLLVLLAIARTLLPPH